MRRHLALQILLFASVTGCLHTGDKTSSGDSGRGLFLDGPSNYGRVAVDARGGVHVIHGPGDTSNAGVHYGYCASGCDQPSSWTFTVVPGATERFGASGFAVDGQGRPRVFFSDAKNVGYSECNSNCMSSSSWTTTMLATPDAPNGYDLFAVAADGGAAFAYGGASGLIYESCASNCANASSWQQTLLLGPAPGHTLGVFSVALTMDAQGRPRLLYSVNSFPTGMTAGTNFTLGFITCDQGCTSASSWTNAPLASGKAGYGIPQLAVDAQGRLRGLALMTNGSGPDGIAYGWCDTNCSSAQSWHSIPGPAGIALAGNNLALDGQGNPHVVSEGPGTMQGTRYTWCSAGCNSTSPTWQQMALLDADMDAVDPVTASSQLRWTTSHPPRIAIGQSGRVAIISDGARSIPTLPVDEHGVFLRLDPMP
jgi:hypothetical protein